jgi:hypothetical protein
MEGRMKPSQAMIRKMMGDDRAPSKVFAAKKIQEIINRERPLPEDRGMVMGILWFFSGKKMEDLNDDVNELYDATKQY